MLFARNIEQKKHCMMPRRQRLRKLRLSKKAWMPKLLLGWSVQRKLGKAVADDGK
jgi:hypothetical protein